MSYEYGCVVCIHREECKPNPFGICKRFEEEGEDNEQREKGL
jgi:hypothetical protein